jgi:hypothetical protein
MVVFMRPNARVYYTSPACANRDVSLALPLAPAVCALRAVCREMQQQDLELDEARQVQAALDKQVCATPLHVQTHAC